MPERTGYFLPFFAAGVVVTLPRAVAFLADIRTTAILAGAGRLVFAAVFVAVPLDTGGLDGHLFVSTRWITGFAGTIGTIAVARLIGDKMPIFCMLGRVSMPIYVMSPITCAVARVAVLRLGVPVSEPAWIVILMLASVLLPWAIYEMLRSLGLAGLAGLDKARRPVRLGSGNLAPAQPPVAQ